jgi:hypothetical protein
MTSGLTVLTGGTGLVTGGTTLGAGPLGAISTAGYIFFTGEKDTALSYHITACLGARTAVEL